MNRHSVRLLRFATGVVTAAVVAPWLGGAVAFAGASKPAPPSGDDRATSFSGNATACADIGLGDDTTIGGSTGDVTTGGWNVTSNGTDLTVTAVPADSQIDALVVKGGDGYNVYAANVFATLPVTGLHAPLVGNPPKNVPTISHWFLCSGPADHNPPPVFVAPSGSVTPGCDSATVDVSAGSDQTTFVITHDNTSQQDVVPANAGDEVVIPWSGESTVSVSVLDSETVLDSQDRDSATCDVPPPPTDVTNPAVSFSNSCKKGISVVMSNMDGTVPVTFTVFHDGTSEDVIVGGDQMRKRNYAVDEDTTGKVVVSAPGLEETSHSYAKNCTTVLGEKVVKTPETQAAGEQQQQLPFTGLPTGIASALAALMVATGAGLTYAGRRRRARHAG